MAASNAGMMNRECMTHNAMSDILKLPLVVQQLPQGPGKKQINL
jgi:hypothetical protein